MLGAKMISKLASMANIYIAEYNVLTHKFNKVVSVSLNIRLLGFHRILLNYGENPFLVKMTDFLS